MVSVIVVLILTSVLFQALNLILLHLHQVITDTSLLQRSCLYIVIELLLMGISCKSCPFDMVSQYRWATPQT